MKYLLDTNIYFHTLHDPAYLPRAVRRGTAASRSANLPQQCGASRTPRGDVARARVGKAVEPLERVGRVVAPTHPDWTQAGVAQGRIWEDSPSLRTKALQNDILIACTARRIGAIVITENSADFNIIRPYVPHRALTLEELARQLGA